MLQAPCLGVLPVAWRCGHCSIPVYGARAGGGSIGTRFGGIVGLQRYRSGMGAPFERGISVVALFVWVGMQVGLAT